MKQTLESSALNDIKTKLTHELPNYSRSSHHYVSVILIYNFEFRLL